MARISLTRMILILALMSSSSVLAQQKEQQQAPPAQTPRQALIEMLRGGGPAIIKHLTVEMQQIIPTADKTTGHAKASASTSHSSAALTKPSQGKDSGTEQQETTLIATPGMAGFDFGLYSPPFTDKNLETFESGPVLCTYSDPAKKEKMEVRVENHDLRSTEDDIELSLHRFKDGQEQPIPFLGNITIGMKLQEGVWRLNEVSTTVKFRVGDPKFFEEMTKAFQPETQPAAANSPAGKEEEHKVFPISSTVTMLALAEGMYAQQNPEAGFTCSLANLLGEKGAGSSFSQFLDPQIASGTYNGYRFSITGCETRPSEIFHVIAEPLTPGGKAYCINATHNLRVADDGRGATCLAAGKPAGSE